MGVTGTFIHAGASHGNTGIAAADLVSRRRSAIERGKRTVGLVGIAAISGRPRIAGRSLPISLY